jgi:hypothetical protein
MQRHFVVNRLPEQRRYSPGDIHALEEGTYGDA